MRLAANPESRRRRSQGRTGPRRCRREVRRALERWKPL